MRKKHFLLFIFFTVSLLHYATGISAYVNNDTVITCKDSLYEESYIHSSLRSDSLTFSYLLETGVPVADNNSVTLLKDGREKFDVMFDAIRKAKHYIYIEYFNLRNDSIGNALFRLLEEKAIEGVKVRVIYDYFGNGSNDRPLRKRRIKRFSAEGVEVRVFDPIKFPWINHAFHRDHRKIVVIDGVVAFTGGMNVADYYIHGKPSIGKWRDMHIKVEGEIVDAYREIFCMMWEKCDGTPIDEKEYTVEIPDTLSDCTDDMLLAVVDRVPRQTPASIRRAYIESINNAKHLIQIVNPYFTLVPTVKRALYDALERGVRVEIMLSTKCDVAVSPDVSAYNVHKLMKRGADIFYYEDGFHHSKFMIVDSLFCTIGSANLNSRSLKFDYEVNTFIFDVELTRQLQQVFEEDKKKSTVLTSENWKERRSFGRRFMGWFYQIIAPLI